MGKKISTHHCLCNRNNVSGKIVDALNLHRKNTPLFMHKIWYKYTIVCAKKLHREKEKREKFTHRMNGEKLSLSTHHCLCNTNKFSGIKEKIIFFFLRYNEHSNLYVQDRKRTIQA